MLIFTYLKFRLLGFSDIFEDIRNLSFVANFKILFRNVSLFCHRKLQYLWLYLKIKLRKGGDL